MTSIEEEEDHTQDSLGNTIINPSQKIESTNQIINHPKLSINDLPSELLIQIFTHLDPIYLNSLRLVCKHWNYIINDKELWMKSFQLRFNIPITSSSFPSLSQSSNWMNEYFMRLQVNKNWKRGISIHKTYQIINNEHRFNDLTMVDFGMNKILTYDKRYNNISIGKLSDGKNQGFIPGGNINGFSTDVLCFDINWNYLVIGTKNGEIILKNLYTSTSSVSQRSSVTKFDTIDEESPIMDIIMNKDVIISGSFEGIIKCWDLQGKIVKKINLEEEVIYNISSDFKKHIIVNTDRHIFVIDYQTGEIISKIDLGFIINENESIEYDLLIRSKNKLDVDYGTQKIIICYKSFIRVFYFDNHNYSHRELKLEKDIEIIDSHFQIAPPNKFFNRNTYVVGQDGLLYGNLLSDGSVIIWNVREDSLLITPIIQIYPQLNHKKYSHGLNHAITRHNLLEITSFAMNGTMIAIGGYNGLTNLYDVFTGKFIREISVKYPTRFQHMHNSLVPITSIQLNPNQIDNNGIIICGDAVQYFEFGEIKQPPGKSSSSQRRGQQQQQQLQKSLNNRGKSESVKKIRDGLEDYDEEIYRQLHTDKLLDKYNGNKYEDEDEELMMALALSESMNNSRDASEISINESLLTPDDKSQLEEDEQEMDEELRRALELSLIEH
ncbi:ubiquitin ligase complex F-box protein UFO1 [Candida albicans P75010]|nr:ubiquitin ligase complex F-box protein UFO1 [Candida albicans P75010]